MNKEKSTNAEIELRVSIIYDMIIKGCSRKEIVQFGSNKWNITNRQVDDYIAKANNDIKEVYGQDYKEMIINKQLAQLDDLYNKNYQLNDLRECRNLIESKSKLLGLNAPIKTDITSGGDKMQTVIIVQDAETKADLERL